jgi:hypothetical protein
VQEAQFAALKSIIDREKIDCDLFLTRSFDVLFDEDHAAAVKEFMLQQQSTGASWTKNAQWLEGEDLEKVRGRAYHLMPGETGFEHAVQEKQSPVLLTVAPVKDYKPQRH